MNFRYRIYEQRASGMWRLVGASATRELAEAQARQRWLKQGRPVEVRETADRRSA